MAHPRYSVCWLTSALCLESRCPLAECLEDLRLHDLPIPDELRLSSLSAV